ncbi:unnamed protein product [Parnassius apollo]|uniref:(apollo) hypothetical protein n=1 Tax=Parnassius apollo TaxID=110799 RepID=A0A8S3WI24_PARAO|nr:unnamed protein product [Parnassius apollo]
MFKLVRIDDENHPEIPLLDGKQVIGRCQFDCDDKRISRNHAELETTTDTVIIKALHTNPCFYVNKNMPGAKTINQNSTVCGFVGDKIGFLPDKLWFEIRNKDINGDKPVDISDIQPLRYLIQKRKDILETSKNDNSENVPNRSAVTETITVKKELNETNVRLDPPSSPSILSTEKTQVLTQLSELEESTNQTPGKRCLCKEEPVSPFALKKVKKEENTENDKPKCSDSQASSSGTSTANDDQFTSKKVLPRRERCMYGADCYRKNPQHKAQFSHPSDSDWGSGPQAPCPYGLACARRDPRHWRDHTHPDGMHPPPPPGMKKRNTHIVQRHGKIIYVNANTVNFYDDHFEAEDSDGESVDYDYEFD